MLGETEVTIGQFRRFVVEGGTHQGIDFEDSDCPILIDGSLKGNRFSEFESQPMVEISWEAAINYCEWLTLRERDSGRLPEGYEYNLPTEAQWEYACRAGTTTNYSFSNSGGGLGDYAWYKSNSGGRTHPVGEKLANPWGLHDMHGNVWEWCRDWSSDRYSGGSVTNPAGPITGEVKIKRGGSWSQPGELCRSAWRYADAPTSTHSHRGFRVALVAE